MVHRCDWAQMNDLEQQYHDNEWGKPVHDDQKLFEMLMLESFQAGLSWDLILKKRENFRRAFDGFDYHKIATYDEAKFREILSDSGVIRHSGKIRATITNAQVFLKIQDREESFDRYIWSKVGNKVQMNIWTELAQVPSSSDLSDRISKDLKKEGFKFLGTTSVYSYLQAIGIINDHLVSCDFK